MAKRYPLGFRDDVLRVARQHDPGMTPEQVVTDFGIHPMTLSASLRKAEPATDQAEGTLAFTMELLCVVYGMETKANRCLRDSGSDSS